MGVTKIEDMIMQSRLQWYGDVIRGDINSQIRKATEFEKLGKRGRVDQRNCAKSA